MRISDDFIFFFANVSIWVSRPVFAATCALRLRRIPDFARPRLHGDLIQWRKHFDRNPLFGTFCDKLEAREWARGRAPELPAAQLLWVGADPEAIPTDLLSDGGVVVKSTTGCGANYFPGRTPWSAAKLRRRLRRWVKPADRLGEWGYLQGRPRLFVEQRLGAPDEVVDLTFRCHDGEISLAFVARHWKSAEATAAYLSPAGVRLHGAVADAAALTSDVLLPGVFERAAAAARRISAGIDQLRVDFIIRGEEIHLGELTVYSGSGFGDEERLGFGRDIEARWLAAIDKSWFLSTPQPGWRRLYADAFRRWVPKRLAELAADRAIQSQ